MERHCGRVAAQDCQFLVLCSLCVGGSRACQEKESLFSDPSLYPNCTPSSDVLWETCLVGPSLGHHAGTRARWRLCWQFQNQRHLVLSCGLCGLISGELSFGCVIVAKDKRKPMRVLFVDYLLILRK